MRSMRTKCSTTPTPASATSVDADTSANVTHVIAKEDVMELITKSSETPLEIHKFDGDEGKLVAYVTTFNNADVVGDIMAPESLDKFVKEFNETEKQLPMLWQHDKNELIGEWTKFEINSRGVKGYGEIFTDVTRGNDVRNLIKRGAVGSVSVGFRSKNYEQLEGGGRLFKEIDLVETSVVVNPANPKARIVSAKNEDGKIDIKLVENALRDVGLGQKERKMLLAGGVKELMRLRDVADPKMDLVNALKQQFRSQT